MEMRARVALWVCVGLLVAHALVGWTALERKSSTFDEPLHALAGLSYLKTGDLRVNPEHPPVWKYWAGLVQRETLNVDWGSAAYRAALVNPDAQWNWTVETLYRTKGNDGEKFVRSARAGMWVISVALGGVLAWWGYRLGGAVGAIGACGLYCLDANFLAHGGLVTNDVAVSLVFAVVGWLLWEMRERVTWGKVVGLGAVCGLGVCTKFTAVVLGPVVVGLMLWAAIRAKGRERWRRGVLIGVVGLIAWGVMWACYGFRFAPGGNGELLETWPMVRRVQERRFMAGHDGRAPTEVEWKLLEDAGGYDTLTRAVLKAEKWKVAPQGWLYGLLMSHATTVYNPGYLLGEIRGTGWWYYFPVAMGVKTAVGTIVLVAVALGILAVKMARVPAAVWAPVVAVMAFAMTSAFNIGVRHVLPVYPFLYVLIGYAASLVWGKRWARAWLGVIGAGVAVEVLLAWPNYIAFFNASARPNRLLLLGDSNLDWGQDLVLLKSWQDAHPKETLWLAYFGTADPEAYGIKYHNMPGGYDAGGEQAWPEGRGTVAVSATVLQGIYGGPRLRERYGRLKQFEVKEILGGSIYLYDYPFKRKAGGK